MGYDLIVEPLSTNTLENVLFSIETLDAEGLRYETSIIVAQPHRQRRVWLTCRRWMQAAGLINNHPPAEPEAEPELFGGEHRFRQSMLGEVRRIMQYGRKGDIEMEEPPAHIIRMLRDA